MLLLVAIIVGAVAIVMVASALIWFVVSRNAIKKAQCKARVPMKGADIKIAYTDN